MEPLFSERIYKTISRRVTERTQRGLSRTKSKFEVKLSNLRQAVKTADHTTRRKCEHQLKQCEHELGSSLHRLEQESASYLEKLGIRPKTTREKQSSDGGIRPQTTYSTLLDRPGSRAWAKTASGGKMKDLLSETQSSRLSPMVSNWDLFVGYKGPPYPPKATADDIASLLPRDTQQFLAKDKYHEYGTNKNTICRKELPRHAKKATAAQALLYLKLREDHYTKDEAIKHSSNITFKTDSGLHQLKGTTDPFMFNGLHVRVPVSDPENRFKPVTALEDHKDFDMLSDAYEKFLTKYTVSNGEFEPNAAFFPPRHHTQLYIEKPQTAARTRPLVSGSKRRDVIERARPPPLALGKVKRTASETNVQQVKPPILVELEPSKVAEDDVQASEEHSPDKAVPRIAIRLASEIPSFPSEDGALSSISVSQPKLATDVVARVEKTISGTIVFRCVDPKAEAVSRSVLKKRKSIKANTGDPVSSPRHALTEEVRSEGAAPESGKVSARTARDKWDERMQAVHVEKLKNVRPTVVTSRPALTTGVRSRTKKEQLEEDRCLMIEQENQKLLQRMSAIITAKPQVPAGQRGKSLNKDFRRKEQIRVMIENQALLRRLQDRQSSYSIELWRSQRKETERLLKNICQFPYKLGSAPSGLKRHMSQPVLEEPLSGQDSARVRAQPRVLPPLKSDPKSSPSHPETVLKRGLSLGDHYFLLEIQTVKDKVKLSAIDVDTQDQFSLKITKPELREIVGDGEDKYEKLVERLALQSEGLVLIGKKNEKPPQNKPKREEKPKSEDAQTAAKQTPKAKPPAKPVPAPVKRSLQVEKSKSEATLPRPQPIKPKGSQQSPDHVEHFPVKQGKRDEGESLDKGNKAEKSQAKGGKSQSELANPRAEESQHYDDSFQEEQSPTHIDSSPPKPAPARSDDIRVSKEEQPEEATYSMHEKAEEGNKDLYEDEFEEAEESAQSPPKKEQSLHEEEKYEQGDEDWDKESQKAEELPVHEEKEPTSPLADQRPEASPGKSRKPEAISPELPALASVEISPSAPRADTSITHPPAESFPIEPVKVSEGIEDRKEEEGHESPSSTPAEQQLLGKSEDAQAEDSPKLKSDEPPLAQEDNQSIPESPPIVQSPVVHSELQSTVKAEAKPVIEPEERPADYEESPPAPQSDWQPADLSEQPPAALPTHSDAPAENHSELPPALQSEQQAAEHSELPPTVHSELPLETHSELPAVTHPEAPPVTFSEQQPMNLSEVPPLAAEDHSAEPASVPVHPSELPSADEERKEPEESKHPVESFQSPEAAANVDEPKPAVEEKKEVETGDAVQVMEAAGTEPITDQPGMDKSPPEAALPEELKAEDPETKAAKDLIPETMQLEIAPSSPEHLEKPPHLQEPVDHNQSEAPAAEQLHEEASKHDSEIEPPVVKSMSHHSAEDREKAEKSQPMAIPLEPSLAVEGDPATDLPAGTSALPPPDATEHEMLQKDEDHTVPNPAPHSGEPAPPAADDEAPAVSTAQ